jgi:hypothetical protein
MNYVNLTGHEIHEINSDLRLPNQGTLRILSASKTYKVDGVPYKVTTITGVVGLLPPKVKGTRYIVSALTARALVGRKDLLVPGDVVRDSKGNPTGCNGFRIVTDDSF